MGTYPIPETPVVNLEGRALAVLIEIAEGRFTPEQRADAAAKLLAACRPF